MQTELNNEAAALFAFPFKMSNLALHCLLLSMPIAKRLNCYFMVEFATGNSLSLEAEPQCADSAFENEIQGT